MICHNAHNRKTWKYRAPASMSSDGSYGENKYRWKLDPPSMNTETKFEERVGAASYDLNRRYLMREEETDMRNWILFELAGLNTFSVNVL